jgi:Na+-driven multidrug efflux pump
MYILAAAGLINVLFNLLFVAQFHWDAAGVAAATSISNVFSALAVLFLLFHPAGEQRLSFSALRIHKKQFIKLLKIGIPSGLNGTIFSISNVILMSAVNSFQDEAIIAGNSASSNLEAVVFQILASLFTACVSFSGQNYGARDLKRIDRLFGSSVLLGGALLLFVDIFIVLFPEFFMGLFTQDASVIDAGKLRLIVVCCGYPLYLVSEMSVGCTRGMGKTIIPMCLNAFFICVPRIFWTVFVFPYCRTLWFLFLCYPISWTLSSIAQLFCYFFYRKKEEKRFAKKLKAA